MRYRAGAVSEKQRAKTVLARSSLSHTKGSNREAGRADRWQGQAPRATFALLLSLLPASAAIIGIILLHQIPRLPEIAGILLVAGGVVLHQEVQASKS
jgi:hypothetical protein